MKEKGGGGGGYLKSSKDEGTCPPARFNQWRVHAL